MRTYRSLEDVERAPAGRALAVGTFDGVHLGHRQVIGSALERGRALGVPATVVTFDPHPLELLNPRDAPPLITPTSVKEDLIRDLGADELVVIPFSRELSEMSAERFCADVLAGTLGARHVSVGENFRFGHGATGDPELLRSQPQFETSVVPLLEHDGEPVSSSRIRRLIAEGGVVAAGELLGAPFQLQGTVVRGDERGRQLGMPTANLLPEPGSQQPAAGVYAGMALGRPAAINVGVRPTFGQGGDLLVEAHLLDFEGDLYGQPLRVTFLERLRDEQRFDSAQDLVNQMERDVKRTREIVAGAPAE